MAKPLYDITQCALYKVESKARLAGLLHLSVPAVLGMAKARKYRQFWLEESVCPFTGKIKKRREVQAPAEALRPLHDRIHDLLRRVAPPTYAHAAIKGKSYRSNAAAHKDSVAVVTYDLKSFYSTTSETAVFRFFADQLCCAHDIAGLFARLICVVGSDARACLPTGSPLSPLVSIYANKPLFDALARLSKEHGLTFTCYVDDLTFSGAVIPTGFTNIVASLVKRYGHTLAATKTRTFGPGKAKHITGVVIQNGKITVPNSRFHKARKIQQAIDLASDRVTKILLMQKLAGLLGEAAFLDPRYKPWAQRTHRALSDFRLNSPMITNFSPTPTESSMLGTDQSMDDSLPF
jgi:RNA-directed DNA polymerase